MIYPIYCTRVWLLCGLVCSRPLSTTLLISRENVCIAVWKRTAATLNICCDFFLLLLMHINLTVLGLTNIVFFHVLWLHRSWIYALNARNLPCFSILQYIKFICRLAANFLIYITAKYCKNQSTFDWAMTKIKRVTFFGTHAGIHYVNTGNWLLVETKVNDLD